MRLKGFLALALLSVIILSYGVSASFAQTSDSTVPPLSVKSELPLYEQGDQVTITGLVKTLNTDYSVPVTMLVKDPNGNIVSIAQIMPQSDGTFQKQLIASGPLWKVKGDYTISVQYGSAQKASSTFFFNGGTGDTTTDTLPPPPKCEPGQIAVDGKCVDEKPTTITCKSNETLVAGKCVPKVVEPEPEPTPDTTTKCGPGTELKDGVCVAVKPTTTEKKGGGCLIATAAYGTELAPQVQFLREIRDNTVLSTSSGAAFMTGFNQFYYSFSPTVADWERENPIFQESVRAFITPMISSLSILTLADQGSESSVLGFGLAVITLNIGLYIAAPTVVGFKVHKYLKSRK